MNRAQLLQHFDTLAETPDAVEKLRAFVLDLAIRGQLVPQTSKPDKDAAWQKFCRELDEQVHNSESPSLFEIPDNWHWVVLDEIAEACGQKRPDERFTYIDVGAIDNVRGVVTPDLQVLDADEAPSRARKLVRSNSVIYSTVRPNLRNIAVIEKDFDPPAIVSTAFAVLHPKPFLNSRYLFLWLRSAPFQEDVAAKMKGVAYPAISDSELWQCPIPIPPPEEQRRIVAKVEELLALCDALEEAQTAAREHRTRLVRSALDHLTTAKDELDFRKHSAFVLQHSDFILDSASALRQAILSLAVQGRFSPKGKLLKELSLGELLAEPSVNGVSKPPNQSPVGVEILRISAGTARHDFFVNEDDFKHIELTDHEVEKFRLRSNDLLACRFNGNLRYVGRFSLYRAISGRTQVNSDKLIRFRVDESHYLPRFICYAMNAQPTRTKIEALCATTAGNIGISSSVLKEVSIAIPPLAEQQRIVAKVDELLRWCDALEARLTAVRTTAIHLLDATLHQILTA